jgi:hypothetical protein
MEVTAIISGEVSFNGKIFSAGDIITVTQGESIEFAAVTDAVNVVIKVPCVIGDKYLD